MERIKILVCCHKECEIPQNELFLPIQVGKRMSKTNLGIQSDYEVDNVECENISDMNSLFCEMTAMFWAWKNIKKIYPSLEYIGLCHYRRYFSPKKNYNWFNLEWCRLKSACKVLLGREQKMELFDHPKVITSINSDDFNNNMKAIENIIIGSDVVYTQPVCYINNSVRQCFEVIGRDYINILEKYVKDHYWKYYEHLQLILNGKKLYSANMIILRCGLLDEYCSFVFDSLFFELDYLITNGYIMNKDEKIFSRVLGYLAELLTATYIDYLLHEGRIGNEVGKLFVQNDMA